MSAQPGSGRCLPDQRRVGQRGDHEQRKARALHQVAFHRRIVGMAGADRQALAWILLEI